ncbi:MAG TPA: GNAT family N-acetyltransferase [Chthonomonadaceae bacterium]|nr:GNAT family N-acetyltransferase [Chthonomonadaceae bacterium]
MAYVVCDFNPEELRDAERLADMFNDFDSAWPGGFTRGMRETAERVQERFRQMRRLAMCVVESSEGEFVGYCDLEAQPGQTDLAYIPLLGARLSHHGKGVGKMLLRELVRRATEMGYRQVTLHTWPGNTKAVPLYKKTGFNWVPETNVFMRNFIPTALTIPAGKAFFANRDWYECLEREIVVAPDDVKWKGMQVFPYRFRAGDDFLNLVFDAAGQRLTAIETPAYSVACSIPMEDAPAGETVPITWEIVPRGKPLEVVLLTEADAGLELSVQERFVAERETVITREVRLSSEAEPRREGEPAHRVRSMLLIDGQPLVLETGVKIVRPIEIEYSGQGLFPGRAEKVAVVLQSNLDRPVQGRLALDAHPAIACESPVQEFTLPPRLRTQCEFTVTVREPGVFPTQARYEAEGRHGSRPVTFRAFSGQAALASIDPVYGESAVLESPDLQVNVYLRGGWMRLNHPSMDRGFIGTGLAELGPPFMDWRMRPPLYTARVDQRDGAAALTIIAPSQEFPGLVVECSLSLLGGEVVRMDYRVSNTTDAPLPARLRHHANGWLHRYLVAPTPEGLIREPVRWGEYPSGETDILAHRAKLTENWVAGEEENLVCGQIWTDASDEEMHWSFFPNLFYDVGEVPPHGMRALPPIYLVAGAGDWKKVRGWWRRLIQPSGIHEPYEPEPGRVLEVRADPSPALLHDDQREVRLSVINRRGKALCGTLTVTGEMLEPAETQFPLEDLDRDRTFTAAVEVVAADRPAAGFLEAAVDSGPVTETFRVPVIRLGGGKGVRVEEAENGTFLADNGLLRLRVAPGHLGSLYALEYREANHLFSSYPEPRPFRWANPWFGGIHPYLGWMGNPRLAREKFTGEPIERVGERGLHWQGVRAACTPEHKDLRWLGVEVEYLTTPGSNVVAVVLRLINRSTAQASTGGGIAVWPQLGGVRENAIVHWESEGERRVRRRGVFQAGGRSGPWTAVENTDTGDILLLVASDPNAHTGFDDWEKDGVHLSTDGHISFEPQETRELLSWLVLCDNIKQIEAYGALAQARRLP